MQYLCRVGTPEGRVLEEVHEAASESALRAELERRGLHLFEAKARGLAGLRLPRFGRRRKIPIRPLLVFNQELAALLRSGLPLLPALELVLERQQDPTFRQVLSQVRDKVKSGEHLSTAFEEHVELLPPLYPPSLRAGERSGELEGVIRRFIRYQRLLLDARKRVVSALIYPAALVGLSIALIAVMMVYVLPKFTEFFSALKVELPLITRLTMGAAIFVRDNFLLLVGGAAAGGFLIYQFAQSEAGQLAVSRLKLRLPLLGAIFHRMALSEFCRSLSTLLAGGIPVVSSLEISIRAVGNPFMRKRLAPIVQGVREGKSLAANLEETGVVEAIVVDMVKTGETTGGLDSMLSELSDFLDEEVETRLQRILSLLEPVMMMLMGIIVATLLVSVYLPIFSLLGQVQG